MDVALKEAFGAEKCASVEADKGLLSPEALTQFVVDHPDHIVFSSHTGRFPLPRLPDCAVLPIVFIRHPIDRVRSVYAFERQQQISNPGADAAKTMSFKEYVAWRLGYDRLFRDFQVFRCNPETRDATFAKALAFLGTLPFVGLVERYDASIERLNRLLADTFPGIALKIYHANKLQDIERLRQRLDAIEAELGEAAFQQLVDSNRGDLRLFRQVRKSYLEP